MDALLQNRNVVFKAKQRHTDFLVDRNLLVSC